jgi:hypothetical protein
LGILFSSILRTCPNQHNLMYDTQKPTRIPPAIWSRTQWIFIGVKNVLTPSSTHTAVTHDNSLGQLYTHKTVRRAEPSTSFF